MTCTKCKKELNVDDKAITPMYTGAWVKDKDGVTIGQITEWSGAQCLDCLGEVTWADPVNRPVVFH